MRLLAEGQPLVSPNQVGIARYCREVFSRLVSAHGVGVDFWVRQALEPGKPEMPQGCGVVVMQPWRAGLWNRVTGRVRRTLREITMPRYDFYHSTFYGVCPRRGMREVTLVLDMTTELLPDLCGEWGRHQCEIKARALHDAEVCFAISQATAHELAALYPDTAKKIVVTPLGSEHLLSDAAGGADSVAKERFVLFVGQRGMYKNDKVLWHAAADPHWPKGLRIRVAGPKFSDDEEQLLRQLGVQGLIDHVGRVSDDELRRLYKQTLAFIFPSLSEGFGLPLLEAQGLGAPVACSNIPVFHEVAGDAAVFFDPRRSDALAQVIAGLDGSPERRDALIASGRINAPRYTWAACAEKTLAAYKKLVHE